MKLPSFLEKSFLQRVFAKGQGAREYFLALEITSGEIKAAVWQKDGEKITLIKLGHAAYSGDWPEAIKAADQAIVEASASIPQEEIGKAILGVSQSWTKENKILDSRLGDLKKLCSDLSLKPLGFVVISEAVANFLRQIEGVPPSALLVEIDDLLLTVTLVKAGRIETSKVVEKDKKKTIPEQIEEILGDFSVEILPSRILLFDGRQDLEKLKEDLSAYRFSDKLPFLHLPKIEVLDSDFDIRAIALTSGLQMGGVITIEEVIPEESKTEEKLTAEEPNTPQVLSEGENLGFVKNKDILEKEIIEESLPFKEEEKEEKEVIPAQVSSQETKEHGAIPFSFKLPSLPSFEFPQLSFPSLNIPIAGEVKWAGFILFLILAIIAGGFLAAYWYLPRAEVRIWFQAKPLEKDAEITISPNFKEGEGSSNQLVGRVIEAEVSGDKKAEVSGKKTVGDPAKGKITIYNKTENEKKFTAGTILIGNGLKFTLDSEVKIASTAAFSTAFSSTQGQVTAEAIGLEGNLPSGTNFSFKDYPTSSYFAKNEGDLSGGTSREVSIVTKNDQEKLLESLSAELSEKVKESFGGKLDPEERLLEGVWAPQIKEKRFDKEVGAEAQELNLNLTMIYKATAYNEKKLQEKLLEIVKEAVSEGYELRSEETKIEISEVKTKDEETVMKAVIRANLLPKVDIEGIRKKIVGSNKTAAEDYIKNLGSVSQVEIKIIFPLPLSLQTLPRSPQNIKIESMTTL